MAKQNIDYTLYLCTDRSLMRTATIEEMVESAIRGGVTIVQLREKDCSSREFLDTAVRVKKITDRYHIPLIINDRVDIAMAVDAAGVHLGQSDLPVTIARQLLGEEKIIGVSAAKPEEALQAEEEGADYLGIGAMFVTTTKQNTRPVTMETLLEIRSKVALPIVAIGGIGRDNLERFKNTGINGLAVVSAIVAQDNVEMAARELYETFTDRKPCISSIPLSW